MLYKRINVSLLRKTKVNISNGIRSRAYLYNNVKPYAPS